MGQSGFYQNRRIVVIAALVCFRLFFAADIYAVTESAGPDNNPPDEQGADTFAGRAADFPVYLYFADPQHPFLMGERRSGLEDEDAAIFCRKLVDALISGPAGGLARTVPAQTKIRGVFVDDKTAYIDLSRDVVSSHPGGILSELMTIYSVVNTLVLNVDQVDQVKLLIGGEDAETLSGHIDIRFPLNADILLIR